MCFTTGNIYINGLHYKETTQVRTQSEISHAIKYGSSAFSAV